VLQKALNKCAQEERADGWQREKRGREKKERRERGRDGERALRTEERVVSSRVPRHAVGSIVLLREVDHSLSLSHAALIAHRSPIYRVGERTS